MHRTTADDRETCSNCGEDILAGSDCYAEPCDDGDGCFTGYIPLCLDCVAFEDNTRRAYDIEFGDLVTV